MRLALRYWGWLGLSAAALLVLLLAVSLGSGQAASDVAANLAGWAGLALALAAYPAGVAVSRRTLEADRPDWRRIAAFLFAAALVSVFMLTLGNLAAPRLSRLVAPARTGVIEEPAQMTLTQLRDAAIARCEAGRWPTGWPGITCGGPTGPRSPSCWGWSGC